MKIKNLKIRLFKIIALIAIVCVMGLATFSVVSADTYTSTYDTGTIGLQVTNATYQEIDAACATLTIEKSGGGNLQSTTANRYGTGSCTVTVRHNDPQEDIYITYSKPEPGNLSDSAGSDTISNIDNATTCVIKTNGSDTINEQVGYRVENVTSPLQAGVQTDSETACSGIAYNATATAPDEYLFDIEYSDNKDLIIHSTSTTCFQNQCQFDINAQANVVWATVPDTYAYNSATLNAFATTVQVSTTP